MRILWLKSDLLLPLDKGGRLRTWHLLRHLARRHEITYLAFASPEPPSADIGAMREVASHVETVPRREPAKRSLRFYADAATHLLDPLPYAVGKYRSREFRRVLRSLVAARHFDLIVCDFLVPAVNLPRHLPCPAVVFTHNVESEIWRRHAETKKNPLSRLLYGLQYRRMLRYEGRELARFDGVLAVSAADRDTLERLYPGSIREPVRVVPTGVDTSYFHPAPSVASSRELVFTGSMDWLPNEDAMLYFCREILPLIRAEEPGVRLSIVGRAPTPAVKRLASDDRIRVTGRVDDVRPYVEAAAVYVVPLRIGGGTRLKIFEAMAMGKAVVSTKAGAEGLPIVNGEHLVIPTADPSADPAADPTTDFASDPTAGEPRAFARSVVRLLGDIERRRALERAARKLVTDRYDWSAVAGELNDALVRFAARRPGEISRCESRSLALDT
jgi:sugar transferase (PEP-CTERM/EpsH1 system associated)